MDSKNYCTGPMMGAQMEEMVPNKSKAQLPSGNYMNIVPIPLGVQQYNRRKYSAQMPTEYQPRIFYGNECAMASPYDRCHDGSQGTGASIEFYPIATQMAADTDTMNSNKMLQHSGVPVPPVLYTVQRVVTTAQIQSSVPTPHNAYNSNMGNVTTIRNENDYRTALASGVIPGNSSSSGACMSANYQSQQMSGNYAEPQIEVPSCTYTATTSVNYTNGTLPQSGMSQPSSSASVASSTSAAASATTPQSVPRPLQNMIPTCVYLMSRTAVHMEIEGTAECPTQVMLAAALGCDELGIGNKLLAQSVFGLWMCSPLLELQLKPQHRPFSIRTSWLSLLDKHTNGTQIEKQYDEPLIMLRRNVFFSKYDEEKIKDPRIIELLYEEARCNVLSCRYVMEPAHFIMLGGIQARIELGPYNPHTHTISYFREIQARFLPPHIAKNTTWSWLPISRKSSAEVRLLEQFKRIPTSATTKKLMKKYLEFCWALPFYGAANFHGQVEKPVRGLMSLVNHKDVPVLIAINERGVYIIDQSENTLLLGLRYEALSWDYAKPSVVDDPNCLPCIFIQFDTVENGVNVSKLMQIFSHQATMMDALITYFTNQVRQKAAAGQSSHPPDSNIHEEPNPIQNSGNGVLSNKLSRLTLATFDEEGRCIGQMGSLQISY